MIHENSARIRELDGIRGIAILLVIIWHYYIAIAGEPISLVTKVLRFPFYLAWSGVDLFFVLSGFLIGGILLDHASAPNYFKVFYIRRFCRIVPIYFIWLILFILFTSVAKLPLPSETSAFLFNDSMPIFSYFSFTQNFAMVARLSTGARWLGITWSLAVEEQFYLTLPMLIRFVPRRRLPGLLVVLILLVPVVRVLSIPLFPSYIPQYLLLPYRADSLLLGVICAIIVRNETALQWMTAHIAVLRGMLVVLTVGAGWLILLGSIHTFAAISFGYTWLALLYATVLMLAIVPKRGLVKSITALYPLRVLGMLAYGLYLFHQSVNGIVHGIFLNQVPAFRRPVDAVAAVIAFVLTFLLAYLSWTYFEKPLVGLGHRFAKYEMPQTATLTSELGIDPAA